jgi:aminoglycoside phosphotransferase family enzyme
MLASAHSNLKMISAAGLLAKRETYPERPQRIELVETPYSWVYFADRHVYKLKKPVKFGPLDFSSRSLRRQACVDELWLNQRLTSGVYQGVVPVVRDNRGHLTLGGGGVPVDWTVKMRRLPEERNLGVLLENNRLSGQDIRVVADTLASFFLNRPPVTLQLATFREHLSGRIRANQTALENRVQPGLCDTVRHIHGLQLKFLDTATELLNTRVGDGLIVDGHGDLQSAHIYIEHQPQVIDCIEYSPALRQVDAVDDLCFLLIECERLNRQDVSAVILAEYVRHTCDHVPEKICNFYKSYRACVWARFVLLQAMQNSQRGQPTGGRLAADDEEQYLRLAEKYAVTLSGQ